MDLGRADRLGSDDMVLVIAEAGVNHNGDEARAHEMVEVAAATGADYVKFQTFVPNEVISIHAKKAAYQQATTGDDDSQLEMVRSLALSEASHLRLRAHCDANEIGFLSTPFDLTSLRFLSETMALPLLKIPSGEITNGPLILAAARTGCEIILSTGMTDISEVKKALAMLAFGYMNESGDPEMHSLEKIYAAEKHHAILKEKVTLLHCTSEYPAPPVDLNLRAISTMSDVFSLPIGLSDHSAGINAAIAATALGATIVEKHFTLDRSLPGPDHKASLEPAVLRQMIAAIRETSDMLGDGEKRPKPSELRNISIVRKSVVAAKPISKGHVLTVDDLACKRPGEGLSPMHFWQVLGTVADKDYSPDEPIGGSVLD
jgi:N-acetylneuraminate synthase